MSKASFLSSLQASLLTVGTYRETHSGPNALLPGGVHQSPRNRKARGAPGDMDANLKTLWCMCLRAARPGRLHGSLHLCPAIDPSLSSPVHSPVIICINCSLLPPFTHPSSPIYLSTYASSLYPCMHASIPASIHKSSHTYTNFSPHTSSTWEKSWMLFPCCQGACMRDIF